MTQEYLTNSFTQTKKLGEKLAKEILKKESSSFSFNRRFGRRENHFFTRFCQGFGGERKNSEPNLCYYEKVSSFKFQVPTFLPHRLLSNSKTKRNFNPWV